MTQPTDGDPPDPPVPPVNPARPMATQSRQSGMIADKLGVLTYRRPFDTRRPTDLADLIAELGPIPIPEEDGTYYLVFVRDAQGRSNWCLVPEGELRAFDLGVGMTVSLEVARQLAFMNNILPAETTEETTT